MSNNIINVQEQYDFVLRSLVDKKIEDIKTMDLGDNSPVAKYIVIASGTSAKHISKVAEYIGDELKNKFKLKIVMEGLANSDWVIVDAGFLMIHLFIAETRNYIKLEELWQERISLSGNING